MSMSYLQSAAAALERQPYVLGGASDGGVCLMGAAQAWPPIDDLPWSTNQLGQAISERCGVPLLLPPLRDVDELTDLTGLATELSTDARQTRIALREWLMGRPP